MTDVRAAPRSRPARRAGRTAAGRRSPQPPRQPVEPAARDVVAAPQADARSRACRARRSRRCRARAPRHVRLARAEQALSSRPATGRQERGSRRRHAPGPRDQGGDDEPLPGPPSSTTSSTLPQRPLVAVEQLVVEQAARQAEVALHGSALPHVRQQHQRDRAHRHDHDHHEVEEARATLATRPFAVARPCTPGRWPPAGSARRSAAARRPRRSPSTPSPAPGRRPSCTTSVASDEHRQPREREARRIARPPALPPLPAELLRDVVGAGEAVSMAAPPIAKSMPRAPAAGRTGRTTPPPAARSSRAAPARCRAAGRSRRRRP